MSSVIIATGLCVRAAERLLSESLQGWERVVSVWSGQKTLRLPACCRNSSGDFSNNRMAEEKPHVLCMDSLQLPLHHQISSQLRQEINTATGIALSSVRSISIPLILTASSLAPRHEVCSTEISRQHDSKILKARTFFNFLGCPLNQQLLLKSFRAVAVTKTVLISSDLPAVRQLDEPR